MLKYILTIIFSFNLSAHAWETKTIHDDFDGEYTNSIVEGSGEWEFLKVQTSEEGNSVWYANGDKHVCTNPQGWIEVKLKFDDNEPIEVSGSASADNSQLSLTFSSPSAHIWQVYWLNKYNQLKIRTVDACGEKRTVAFDISGETHLKISKDEYNATVLELLVETEKTIKLIEETIKLLEGAGASDVMKESLMKLKKDKLLWESMLEQ